MFSSRQTETRKAAHMLFEAIRDVHNPEWQAELQQAHVPEANWIGQLRGMLTKASEALDAIENEKESTDPSDLTADIAGFFHN